ncbi:hypothetical protein BKA64DRAFT_636160 [Cadophora sp. MPI-SDFR-AT-0126]|nr:hypothetical protein BKA64DRAFT_636160 [Leotiomycetes sp. MPI-SDFR-AT-0126]
MFRRTTQQWLQQLGQVSTTRGSSHNQWSFRRIGVSNLNQIIQGQANPVSLEEQNSNKWAVVGFKALGSSASITSTEDPSAASSYSSASFQATNMSELPCFACEAIGSPRLTLSPPTNPSTVPLLNSSPMTISRILSPSSHNFPAPPQPKSSSMSISSILNTSDYNLSTSLRTEVSAMSIYNILNVSPYGFPAISETLGLISDFTLFPKLPTEIRLKIWFHSLPGPRVIEIDRTMGVGSTWCCRKESQGIPSGLLRANRESRREFLRFYSRFLKVNINKTSNAPIDRWPNSATYICPAIDPVYICANRLHDTNILTDSMEALSKIEVMKNVEVLACEFLDVVLCYDNYEPNVNHLPSLKSILVVMADLDVLDLSPEEYGMQRPQGEIEFHEEHALICFTDGEKQRLSAMMENAKEIFLGPSAKETATCSSTFISRGGVLMGRILQI